MKLTLFALLLIPTVLFSQEKELVVRLSAEKELLPIYLTPPNAKNSKLREVLAFDLDHNGMTHVLTEKEISLRSSLAHQEDFTAPLDFAKLKKEQVLYLVKLQIQDRSLVAKVISTTSQSAHTIDNIPITGDLSRDRQVVHTLADTIHKMLFGTEGIASCHILFCSKNGPTSEVFEADYDGKNMRQITKENALTAHPQYIPGKGGAKSQSFLYVSYKIGQPKLYESPLHHYAPKRISTLRGNQVTPSISKEGSLVAFACDTAGRADIFMQEKNSSNLPQQIFTAKAAANASPVFSPDGKRIAFVSNKDGSPRIYVMNIPKPGTKLQNVTLSLISKRCRENSAPSWSPDGKKLAYCSKTAGNRQLWVYDFETKTEYPLTTGPSDKENPSWAPNSLHLLFNATDAQGTELYLMNLNQTKAVKITSGPGKKQYPSWEPKNPLSIP
jgi:TolB protein